VTCVTAEDIRWGRCDIKSTALLANVLLKWRAQDAGAAEAILLRDGQLTEGSASSVHVLRDGVLVTPPQSSAVLPGTTRDVLLEIAPRLSIDCCYARVPETALRQAPEIIISSAGGGLRAVTRLDGHPVGDGTPGPVFRRLHEAWLDTRDEFSTECAE
jgi:D-alanine transaminase